MNKAHEKKLLLAVQLRLNIILTPLLAWNDPTWGCCVARSGKDVEHPYS